MCLEKITQRIETPTDEIVTGYKVFLLEGTALRFVHGKHQPVVFAKWMQAVQPGGGDPRRGFGVNAYPWGFHIFYKKDDAELNMSSNRVLKMVKGRKVHTVGIQTIGSGDMQWHTFVAGELFIEED